MSAAAARWDRRGLLLLQCLPAGPIARPCASLLGCCRNARLARPRNRIIYPALLTMCLHACCVCVHCACSLWTTRTHGLWWGALCSMKGASCCAAEASSHSAASGPCPQVRGVAGRGCVGGWLWAGAGLCCRDSLAALPLSPARTLPGVPFHCVELRPVHCAPLSPRPCIRYAPLQATWSVGSHRPRVLPVRRWRRRGRG